MSRIRRKFPKVFKKVEKRDGEFVDFDKDKIIGAVHKALSASNQGNGKQAKEVTRRIATLINRRFRKQDVIKVEEIQDIVEEVLILEGYVETAKAYILYREQHRRIREAKTAIDESLEMVDKYIGDSDWQIRENANMGYSLQGLHQYVVSAVSKKYWLNKIYSKEIRNAIAENVFHIHDIDFLGAYCCGWDLMDLLTRGFGGVSGKVESKPAKHFQATLSQLVNFFYTLQGEVAGANAVSNFDTLLAPFIRRDNLTYPQVKQLMQQFIFNCAIPTRVGFQCVSEDTEILTPSGWKNYQEVEKGDIIKTFNLKSGEIENQKVIFVFKKRFEGLMYRLRNRIQDQLVSAGHRVVRKKFQTNRYVLEPIEEIIRLKTPFRIPIAGKNLNKEAKIEDSQIKLMAWIISEGTIERPTKYRCCYRVSIYQSKEKNGKNYNEIIGLLKYFKLNYSEYGVTSLGDKVSRLRLDAESSKKIHQWFGTKEGIHFIPDLLLNLSERQSRLFLETYLKGDGFEGCKISTTDLDLLDDLQIMAVNSGYGFTVLARKPTIGKKEIYVLRLIKHSDTDISRVERIKYKGIIWCPHTKNETIIARRKGKVFITGNTPFLNITLDIKPPKHLASQPVIIGGLPQNETYGEFQEEMNLLNKAYAEIMSEGDAKGRVFTFPIPTINITKDFEWDNPALAGLWEMTAKYGVPYFANFINSEMSPDDSRSMCPLAGDEKVLIKSSRGRVMEFSEIRNIYEGSRKREEYEIYSDGKFAKGKFNKFENQQMLKIILENGHEIKMSSRHLNFVMNFIKDKKESILMGEELKLGMYLPYSLKEHRGAGGNEDLGYFVGAYAGDGSFSGDGTVVFSLENHYKKEVIEKLNKIAEKYFGAHSAVKEYEGSKLVSLNIHSMAAVGLCRDFVEGKQREKSYRARLFTTSVEFRKAVLAGHYATDGGNRHRIYTSSVKMVETLNMLAATLGTTTSIYKDEREGRFGKEPNYAVLFYQLNRKNYGDFWFKKNEKLWIRIKEIRAIKNDTAYCFEVKNNEPMFTVGTTGILTHNCRLRLDNRELYKRGGGLFGSAPLTGSIGVVTINFPQIGYLSKTKTEFFDRLAKLMDLAKQSLETKRETIERFTEKGLYPYSKYYMEPVKRMRGTYWGNHFSTIGLVGMNEALLNFIDKDITTQIGQKFAKEILDFMREKLIKYQEETGNMYNLEATPAEGASYRLAKKDKEKYPDIITAGEKEPYYTNSTQLPVGFTDDLFEAVELQNGLQVKYTGGTVLHGFLGERISDPQIIKSLLNKIFSKYQLPYLTFTPTFSVCPNHGYISGEHFTCPHCLIPQPCEVYSRIVGYIRPVQQWHLGKQEEFKGRKMYKI